MFIFAAITRWRISGGIERAETKLGELGRCDERRTAVIRRLFKVGYFRFKHWIYRKEIYLFMNDAVGHPVPRMRLLVQIIQSYLLDIFITSVRKNSACYYTYIHTRMHVHIIIYVISWRLLSPFEIDERRTTIRIRAHQTEPKNAGSRRGWFDRSGERGVVRNYNCGLSADFFQTTFFFARLRLVSRMRFLGIPSN